MTGTGTTRPQFNSSKQSYGGNTNTIPLERVIREVQIRQADTVEKERTNKRAEVFVAKGGSFQLTEGILDTAADTTCANLSLHRDLCLAVWDFVSKGDFYVRTTDSSRHKIRKKGLLHIRVGKHDLGLVEVLSVDHPGWTSFLVGEDILLAKGLIEDLN